MDIKKRSLIVVLLLVIAALFQVSTTGAQTSGQPEELPVVRALMFWLSTCGHCEYVINEVLPPLQDQYDDQLEILLVELVSQEDVDRLYETASLVGIAKEAVGVPFMIVGDRVLQGSQEIPNELPVLIEHHLANGGLDYTSLASLAAYLPEAEISTEQNDLNTAPDQDELQSPSTPTADPGGEAIEQADDTRSNGFTLAMIILVGMVLAIVYMIYALLKENEPAQQSTWVDWLIPLVVLAGMGVAGYLTYVETQSVAAVCGPVGDCNAVQNSSYARVLGILPVGILGLLGYAAILIAWIVHRVREDRWGDYARLAMLGMSFFGVVYSIYLTYVEIWVIYAVCIWCLSSAVLMTLLMLLSVQPARTALDSLGDVDDLED